MPRPGERQPEDVELWGKIKHAYETTDEPGESIAKRFGVTRSALYHRAKRDLWRTRNRSVAVDRPLIIKRMFRLLELQMEDLEGRMQELGKTEGRAGEREMTLLGKLAGNLERLIKLDSTVSGNTVRRQRTAKEIADMRKKLARRLDELKRG